MARSSITTSPEDSWVTESYRPEKLEKMILRQCSTYAAKPVIDILAYFFRQRSLQYDFGKDGTASGTQYSGNFSHNRSFVRGQIIDAINRNKID